MGYPSTLNSAIGTILKDTTDWEGNAVDFSKPRSNGIGRYFRSKGVEDDFPVCFDLGLNVSLEGVNPNPERFFSGIQYVLCEAVYNSIKAYRDSEKNTGFLRSGGVMLRGYQTESDYVIEISDRAGGVSKNVLATGLPGEQTIRRTRERKTGSGIGFQTMGRILSQFGGSYAVNHIKECEEVVGTEIKIIIPKQPSPTDD